MIILEIIIGAELVLGLLELFRPLFGHARERVRS